jgi:hypothetical protein
MADAAQPFRSMFDLALRSWYTAEDNTYVHCVAPADLSLPGFVFRGQILSIAVAGVLLGLVLIREWITQHDWTQNMNKEPEKAEEIVPDEWIVQRGIAMKLDELLTGFPLQLADSERASTRRDSGESTAATEEYDGGEGEKLVATAGQSSSELTQLIQQQQDVQADSEGIWTDLGGDDNVQQTQPKGAPAPVIHAMPDVIVDATQSVESPAEARSQDDHPESDFTPDLDVLASLAGPNARPGGSSQIDLAFTAPELLHRRELGEFNPAMLPATVAGRAVVAEFIRDQNIAARIERERQLLDEQPRLGREFAAAQEQPQPVAAPQPLHAQARAGGAHGNGDVFVGDDIEEANLDREDWDGILEGKSFWNPVMSVSDKQLSALSVLGRIYSKT